MSLRNDAIFLESAIKFFHYYKKLGEGALFPNSSDCTPFDDSTTSFLQVLAIGVAAIHSELLNSRRQLIASASFFERKAELTRARSDNGELVPYSPTFATTFGLLCQSNYVHRETQYTPHFWNWLLNKGLAIRLSPFCQTKTATF